METNSSFRQFRGLIAVRNLFFLMFKITTAILSILFIAMVAFIIILSTKPRVIPFINDYLVAKIDSAFDAEINFDNSNATLSFETDLSLQYEVHDFTLKSRPADFKASRIILNADFGKLLFGKIEINDVILMDGFLDVKISDGIVKNKEPINVEKINGFISRLFNGSIIVNNFFLKDFNTIIHMDGTESNVKIIDSDLTIKFRDNAMIVLEDMIFNVNQNKINSRLRLKCEDDNTDINCDVNINNINLNSFTSFFDASSAAFDYATNIKGYFNINANFLFNDKLELKNGTANITSPIGYFYLKQFFDEKIAYTTLNVNASFKDNFKVLNLDSVNAKFDQTSFFMSMFLRDEENYKNIDLNFDVKDLPLINLKQLWPNFLGQEEGVRPWVLEHIIGGKSPHATAAMNMKYFKNGDRKHKSGLQNIYSEVQMDKVLLNYSDYFPEISNIDGLAIFTKKDMLIKINSGNVLTSKINSGTIGIDFTKRNKNVVIDANTKGHFYDLFVHIDKKEKDIIESNVNAFIEDYYTFSNIKLNVPIDNNVNFTTTGMDVNVNLLNKKNAVLKNSSNILLSFTKPRNSDEFFGNIDFTKSNVEYLPLNIYKPANKLLSFDYKASLDGNIVYIDEFNPLVNYLSFDLKGFIDIGNKIQEVAINNIEYNNSRYNVSFKSHVLDGKTYSDVKVSGRNINYSNIVDRIKETKFEATEVAKNVNNESNIKLNLEYLSFANGKKLLSPYLAGTFENNKLNILNFKANMDDKNFIDISLNKKSNMFNLISNDFGKLFDTIGITQKISGGEGTININQKNIDGKDIIVGDLKINKKFTIKADEDVKHDVLSDVEEDKNFKNLKKGLKKDTGITFDGMRGNFKYYNNLLSLDEFVINSSAIKFQILASGFVNLETSQMKIDGLLVPLGFINGLFGINKLPVVSSIIFGQKDGGIFASKFSITKDNGDEKMDINIDKFSTILPGFLRNIFDKDRYKF